MPFDGLKDLKQSRLFLESSALQGMSHRRLERFVKAYNAVHARVLRNGGDETGAKKLAFAIAHSVAKNASFVAGAVESMRHFFSPMAPEMAGRDPLSGKVEASALSFEVIMQDRAVASALISGNAFNLDHDRGEPAGMIHEIIPVEEAPPEVQAQVDPDAPFLIVASYLEGTPEDIRQIETLSPEWLTLPRTDGLREALPYSFAITRKPMNGRGLGIRRIAASMDGTPSGGPEDANHLSAGDVADIQTAVREALG